ncbi:MAG TPA: hypothetical protein VJ788_00700 [Gemmatimonadota bacterium]|nr:hypothetical protein [Gemmatimonadota bacterium]
MQTRLLCHLFAAGMLVLGCESEPAEEPAEELPADTVAAAPTFSLADVAGTWDIRAVPVSGDTTASVAQIVVTPESWTLMMADRDPVEGVVTVSGDSVIVDHGPYESIRREGLMVTTRSVYRREGDRLVGTMVAHYETSESDSVLNLTVEGVRAQ